MSDVELVVKISEEDYINIKNAVNSLIENGVERASMSKVCLAILDSTPLPKGHSDLIDKDKLWDAYIDADYDFYEALDYVPTVIKADRSEQE